MEELIKVKTQGDTQVVSARELYKGLEIAYKLYLPKGAELIIGRLANEYRLKPVFSDSNKYCRRVVDEYGRETWQYTALGARVIEKLIEEVAR